ncbi:DUF2510 domain-containing protein [Nocardioides humilatus]|uniref:DUF2510 domain-containing protein n=1 Tax=Nocardioides humilatus TaxID=2607660 RepID=A0A5B1LI15_9ACTN|nr:DUF2510 domain-containing protein [Nocardioides humilatus]KAA1420315.1 DUF2510 domain-containing protein [Nocardioides humilatus]
MTQAGWYPDPAGQPQTYRYWDGATWSEETTGDPYAPAPVSPHQAPPPPAVSPDATVLAPSGPAASYGTVPPAAPQAQPQAQPFNAYGGGFPPSPATSSAGSARLAILVAAAVVALLLVGIGGFLGIRSLGDDDDSSATDRTSERATPETTVPTSPTDPGTTTTEPTVPTGPVISGGGLTIPVPEGYEADTRYAAPFTFADAFSPAAKVIEQNDKTGWVSIYGVGTLVKSEGYTDPAQAAEAVMAAMAASSDLYEGFTGRTDLSEGALTIDGHDAYQVSAELRVDNPDLTVEGDVAQVIVVDTGDHENLGLYLCVVPLGDDALIAQQAAVASQIQVG